MNTEDSPVWRIPAGGTQILRQIPPISVRLTIWSQTTDLIPDYVLLIISLLNVHLQSPKCSMLQFATMERDRQWLAYFAEKEFLYQKIFLKNFLIKNLSVT